MATLVLGVAGAAIGGFGWSTVAAAALGFAIGSEIGGLIDSANTHIFTAPMGKLNDLRVMVASYGTFIPIAYGNVRVPAIIIWGTSLVEHEQDINSGGGSGGPQVTTQSFTYTVSFACALCRGNSNLRVSKIYANDLVIFDRSQSGNTITAINDSFATQVGESITSSAFPSMQLRSYFGTETQNADPIIISSAGNVDIPAGSDNPAFRGLSYLLFQDMLLTDFGDSLPNISVELTWNGGINFSDVLDDIASQVGLDTSTQVDITQVNSIPITGMLIPNRIDAKTSLQPLMDCYNVDVVDVDGVVRGVPRGLASIVTISWDDLGAMIIGSGDVPSTQRIVKTRQDSLLLPQSIDLAYFSTSIDLQQATQRAVRQSAPNQNNISVSYYLTLTDVEAKQFVEKLIYLAWIERMTYSVSGMPYFAQLCAADCVMVQIDAAGNTQRMRVTEAETGLMGEIRFKFVKDLANVYFQHQVSTAITGKIPSLNIVPTSFFVWSGVELRDTDSNSAGFYVAATGDEGWRGGSILLSVDGGTTYNIVGAVGARTVFGSASNTLGSTYTPDANGFDTTNTISLVGNGVIESTSEASVLGGQGNYGLLLDSNTAVDNSADYEILGFATATLVTTNNYTIADLLRAQRTTLATGHATGDVFVVVSNNLLRIQVASSLIHQIVKVKVVSPGIDPTTVTEQDVYISKPTEIFATSASASASAFSARTPFWRIRGYVGGASSKTNSIDETYFLDASGNPGANHPNPQFTIALPPFSTAGTFTITVDDLTTSVSATTGLISATASASAVKSAIEALSNVGIGNTTVTGSSPNYLVQFTGPSIIDHSFTITGDGSLVLPTPGITINYTPGVLDQYWEEASLSPIDVAWRYETPGMGYTTYNRINLTNPTGSPITFSWWLPAADDCMRIRFAGSFVETFIFGTTDYNQFGTLTVAAGVTELLEIFYFNNLVSGNPYDASSPGTAMFKTNAIASGLSWSDAGK